MPDGEKIPLIEYHFVNPVKYTLLEEQTNTKSYLYKLIVCNICVFINILSILLIRSIVFVLDYLNPAEVIKLEILIALLLVIVTLHIMLNCLTIIKVCLTYKILTISKQFKYQIGKSCALFVILIIIDLSLYISYYAILPNIKIEILSILSTSSIFVAILTVTIEIIYKIIFITTNYY